MLCVLCIGVFIALCIGVFIHCLLTWCTIHSINVYTPFLPCAPHAYPSLKTPTMSIPHMHIAHSTTHRTCVRCTQCRACVSYTRQRCIPSRCMSICGAPASGCGGHWVYLFDGNESQIFAWAPWGRVSVCRKVWGVFFLSYCMWWGVFFSTAVVEMNRGMRAPPITHTDHKNYVSPNTIIYHHNTGMPCGGMSQGA